MHLPASGKLDRLNLATMLVGSVVEVLQSVGRKREAVKGREAVGRMDELQKVDLMVKLAAGEKLAVDR
jgi:hypothetical protein